MVPEILEVDEEFDWVLDNLAKPSQDELEFVLENPLESTWLNALLWERLSRVSNSVSPIAESEGLRGDELDVLILLAIPSLDSSALVFGANDSSIGASDAMALSVSPPSSVLSERGDIGSCFCVSLMGIGMESDIIGETRDDNRQVSLLCMAYMHVRSINMIGGTFSDKKDGEMKITKINL